MGAISAVLRLPDHFLPHVHLFHVGQGWEFRVYFSFASNAVSFDPGKLPFVTTEKPIVVSDAAYHAALVASAQAPRNPWQPEAVRYVEEGNKIVLIFAQGVELAVPARRIPLFSGRVQSNCRRFI